MSKKFKISAKRLRVSLLLGLICAIFMSLTSFNASCDDLRQNVLRLHIIANSNSKADQALKLKIRDRILKESGDIFGLCENVEQAVAVTENQLERFREIANEVISQEKFGYSALAKVEDRYFETRVYDEFTLPAGSYKSLVIKLGKGEGKNWWCVIFPEICLPAATDEGLEKTVSDGSVCIAENPNRYILRFKVVEIYEDIKNWFK